MAYITRSLGGILNIRLGLLSPSSTEGREFYTGFLPLPV